MHFILISQILAYAINLRYVKNKMKKTSKTK